MTSQVKIRRNGIRNWFQIVAEIKRHLAVLGIPDWLLYTTKIELKGAWIYFEVEKPDS